MDALALLCALHAHGPEALRRLRQAGRTSLASILALDADALAELLATTPAAAQRFQREARHLAERTEGSLLEAEVPETLAGTLGEALEPVQARTEREELREAADGAHGSEIFRAESSYEDALSRWRELDEVEGPQPSAIDDAFEIPAPQYTSLATLAELGPGSRAALEGAGIDSLEALAWGEPLELCRAGLEYSNAVRLSALARRALHVDRAQERFSRAEPLDVLQRDYVLQPAARQRREVLDPRREQLDPRREQLEESPGGPFA